jgi:hypothetical protein
MKEIKLTQDKVTIVDDSDYEWLSRHKWLCDNIGYAARDTYGEGKRKRVFMHRVIMETPDDMETDHINRNKLDNRRVNLRTCTRSQNVANTGIRRDNTSGRKGVSWDKSENKWRATININNKYIQIGRYKNIDDASEAYNKKAIELFGEFAYREE